MEHIYICSLSLIYIYVEHIYMNMIIYMLLPCTILFLMGGLSGLPLHITLSPLLWERKEAGTALSWKGSLSHRGGATTYAPASCCNLMSIWEEGRRREEDALPAHH